jgi:hypothetical protein
MSVLVRCGGRSTSSSGLVGNLYTRLARLKMPRITSRLFRRLAGTSFTPAIHCSTISPVIDSSRFCPKTGRSW